MKLDLLLRWAARTFGLISTLMLLFFLFGGQEHLHFTVDEATAFVLFPAGVIAGFAIAWRNDMIGGLVSVTSLALFYLYMQRNGARPLGPYFLLFTIPAYLHIAAATAARFANDARDIA